MAIRQRCSRAVAGTGLPPGRALLAVRRSAGAADATRSWRALDPELREALFGTPPRPFSVSLEFPRVRWARLRAGAWSWRARRRSTARSAPATALRHRARFYPQDAVKLRDLFELVGRLDATDVLIDDRPVPYARELWLPLIWFLIR